MGEGGRENCALHYADGVITTVKGRWAGHHHRNMALQPVNLQEKLSHIVCYV